MPKPTARRTQSANRTKTASRKARPKRNGHSKILDRYAVEMVPIGEIQPSPENDDLYGEIEYDEQMEALVDSVRRRGLEEPIILTGDRYILSGHRRFFAVGWLGWDAVPCRIRHDITRRWNDTYHRDLAEYNPQRIKSVGSLLKESLLRDQSPEDTYRAIEEYREASVSVGLDFMHVPGAKAYRLISDKKRPFLEAVQRVVESLDAYWPLSIRQIHYKLLNRPPLISTPKRTIKDPESYRYRNDQRSYQALVRLLTAARYHGHIPMHCIDDPTRPQDVRRGFDSVSEFVHEEVEGFLTGFHRDKQFCQERHIEAFVEKNTLFGMLKPVAQQFYVPLTAGRGFCSIPVWRDMAARFRASGRKYMTLIVISDYDPEGLELADDAVRSLRDLWDIPVDYHRVAVTREQIDELGLAEDFNPAKPSSSQFDKFVERTGGTKTWESEALEPEYTIDQFRAAIEANMDMEIYRRIVEEERRAADELFETKRSIADALRL